MTKNTYLTKSGQVTQSFTFLSAVIIIGLILIFGGYSIYQLIQNVDTIEDTRFRQNMDDKISSVSSKYGSVEIFDLEGLNDFETICVFDLENFEMSSFSSDLVIKDFGLMEGAVDDKTANIFFLDSSTVGDRFLNTNIRIADPFYTCKDIGQQGFVKIRLEGLGKTSKFSFVD